MWSISDTGSECIAGSISSNVLRSRMATESGAFHLGLSPSIRNCCLQRQEQAFLVFDAASLDQEVNSVVPEFDLLH